MEITEKDKDRFVELTLKPEWGRGKIRAVKYGRATIVFENDPEGMGRDYSLYSDVLKLAENQDPTGFKPRFKSSLTGGSLHRKTAIKKEYPRYELSYFIDTFKSRFPGGFEDKKYREDVKKGERAYKDAAIAYFKENFLAEEKMKKALEGRDLATLREHTGKIIGNKINLLYVTENASLLDGFKNEAAMADFFSALLKVLDDPQIQPESMTPFFETVHNFPLEGFSKWTIATLYPFLAQPQRHMFLKPEPTKFFARRIGWELNYEVFPNWKTYSSLLEMTRKYLEELKPLGARDHVDFQSFLWVVYDCLREPKVKKTAKNTESEPQTPPPIA